LLGWDDARESEEKDEVGKHGPTVEVGDRHGGVADEFELVLGLGLV
jgi:hypothetical protein